MDVVDGLDLGLDRYELLEVVDVEHVLLPWMRTHAVQAVAVRPDGVIFATAGADHPLPPSPALAAYVRTVA